MNEFNNLMQNEYEAMAGMNIPIPDLFKNAIDFIKAKLTSDEFIDIESALYSGYIESEKIAFEQGFMRGIVVMKGGAS